MREVLAILKAILFMVVAGAMVVAAVYAAYLLLVIAVMGLVGFGAYLHYSEKPDSIDWDN